VLRRPAERFVGLVAGSNRQCRIDALGQPIEQRLDLRLSSRVIQPAVGCRPGETGMTQQPKVAWIRAVASIWSISQPKEWHRTHRPSSRSRMNWRAGRLVQFVQDGAARQLAVLAFEQVTAAGAADSGWVDRDDDVADQTAGAAGGPTGAFCDVARGGGDARDHFDHRLFVLVPLLSRSFHRGRHGCLGSALGRDFVAEQCHGLQDGRDLLLHRCHHPSHGGVRCIRVEQTGGGREWLCPAAASIWSSRPNALVALSGLKVASISVSTLARHSWRLAPTPRVGWFSSSSVAAETMVPAPSI